MIHVDSPSMNLVCAKTPNYFINFNEASHQRSYLKMFSRKKIMVQLIEWGLEDRGLGLFPFFVFVFYLFLFYFFFIFLKFRYKMYELNVFYIHELKTNKPKKVHTHT